LGVLLRPQYIVEPDRGLELPHRGRKGGPLGQARVLHVPDGSAALKETQSRSASPSGISDLGALRQSRGTMRLPRRFVRSTSSRHTGEPTESGEMMNTTSMASTIKSTMRFHHSSPLRMSERSMRTS
jgi:hypothetical protein